MIQHEMTIHLNHPVDQVFAYVADMHKLHTWQSNLIESEQLTDGPLRVGTHIREVRRMGRRPVDIRAEITDFAPNQRFATQTTTDPRVTVTYDFAAEDGGTRLRYTFVMLTSGMMRLLQPLIAKAIKQQSNADFATLKRVLEG